MILVLPYSLVFTGGKLFCSQKSALEKRVKELEETLATRNTEEEKAAKDATVREEQFVNRVGFLTQNVRGEYLCLLFVYFLVFPNVTCFAHFYPCFDSMQIQLAFQHQ